MFSTFKQVTSSKAIPLSLNKQTFIKQFSKHDIRPEKDGRLFAPATFNKSRSNDNFISASGICLDFDHGQPSIEQVLHLLPGTLAAYYSTHSNTADDPRFRVVIPLSRPVNADEHARLVSWIGSIITPGLMDCLDSTCFERARSHYLPSCPPEHKSNAFAGHQAGDPLDVEHFLSLGNDVDTPLAKQPKPSIAASMPQELANLAPAYEFTDPDTGEVLNLTTWAAQNPSFDIITAVDTQYHRGKPKEGKQHIQCPFEDLHTDTGKDLASFIANASPPQYGSWDIHCCHSHCVNRDRLDFVLAMLEKGWLTVEGLQTSATVTAEIRRPIYVTYKTDEILAAPEWSTLLPDERRIAQDLMIMCWAEIDGMIADDNWAISRRLGLPENDWLSYRETLNRTGWLMESNGRLTSRIVKREFDNAQNAYMDSVRNGGDGGRKAAANRRMKLSPK
jgi:hypothetical protein